MSRFETVADYYRYFAGEAARGGSPLYENLSLAIADDVDLQQLAAKKQPSQPPANVLFAAVQYLLLKGADHPLADYYPSLNGSRPVDSQAANTFKVFCDIFRAELEPLVEVGVTNTNEVGRSSLLAAAYAHLARETGRKLALLELGPSAGLNLNFDRYAYNYQQAEGKSEVLYWAPADLTLACEVRGSNSPDLGQSPPQVASRVGLELNPVDLTNKDQRLWIKALVWPERVDRHARLDTAMEIAERYPPPVRAGNAVENLPQVLSQTSTDAVACVSHSLVLYQFGSELRAQLEQVLAAEGEKHDVYRVGVEAGDDLSTYHLTLTCYRGGRCEQTVMANCDPHGLWLDWLL